MKLYTLACLALVACGSSADPVTPAAENAPQGDAATPADAGSSSEDGSASATDARAPVDASDAALPVDAGSDVAQPPAPDGGDEDAPSGGGLGWPGACSPCYATPLPGLCDSTHFTFKCPIACGAPPPTQSDAGTCFSDVEPGAQTVDWCCPQ